MDVVHRYGYGAIAVGTFFEGETVMLAAGMAVGAGALELPLVVAAGMLGIFASDTLCFLLGRFAAPFVTRRFPRIHTRIAGVFSLIERHHDKLIVFFQFFPGLCTVTPIAFGMTRISMKRFMAFDLVGNALWTATFSMAGLLLGTIALRVWTEVDRWRPWAVLALALAALGWMLWRRRRAPASGASAKAPLTEQEPGA